MTAEENSSQVNKLALEIQSGNTDLLPVLWEAVEGFIRWAAKKRWTVCEINDHNSNGGCEIEDYVNQGYFALLEAVKAFDPERGTSFTSYLLYYLKMEFSTAAGIRTSKRDALHNADSLNEQVFDDEVESAEKIDMEADPTAEAAFADAEGRIFREELHRAIVKAVDALQPVKREIIKGKYLQGHSAAQIATQRGVTEGAIRGQLRAALREMRRQARITGLEKFVDMHTVYYLNYGLSTMQNTGASPVEAIVQNRERLRQMLEAETKYTVIR